MSIAKKQKSVLRSLTSAQDGNQIILVEEIHSAVIVENVKAQWNQRVSPFPII